jgi:hypothetical protein
MNDLIQGLVISILGILFEDSLKMQVGLVSDYDLLALDSISGKSKFSIYVLPFHYYS